MFKTTYLTRDQWHSSNHTPAPAWVPRNARRLFGIGGGEPIDLPEKYLMEEFQKRFKQFIHDARYVADLGSHPLIQETCGFARKHQAMQWAVWCLHNIHWLADDGVFPPPK